MYEIVWKVTKNRWTISEWQILLKSAKKRNSRQWILGNLNRVYLELHRVRNRLKSDKESLKDFRTTNFAKRLKKTKFSSINNQDFSVFDLKKIYIANVYSIFFLKNPGNSDFSFVSYRCDWIQICNLIAQRTVWHRLDKVPNSLLLERYGIVVVVPHLVFLGIDFPAKTIKTWYLLLLVSES